MLKSQSQEYNFLSTCGREHIDNPLHFEKLMILTEEFNQGNEEQSFHIRSASKQVLSMQNSEEAKKPTIWCFCGYMNI